MNNIEKLDYRPFTRFCMSIGAVPSSYLAGLTIEEQLLWLCSYLEKEVIPVVNNNSEVVEELKNYVEHYFDNLDVQEEINNKLDEMAESGDLEEIIASYLNTNALICFDTVSDMISSENLVDGSFAKTLGYYEKNDGGSATYKIRNITNDDVVDNMFIIEMEDNSLVAELIINNIFIPEQLGAKNDGSTNCGDVFEAIFEKMSDNSRLEMAGTYLIEKPLYLPNANNITINGGTLKATSNFNGYILNTNTTPKIGPSGDEFTVENLTIKNLFIDGNYKGNGMYLDNYLRVKIESSTIHNIKQYGIYLNGDSHEAEILNTNIIGKEYEHEDVENTGIYINCHDNIINNCVIAYCQWAIEIYSNTNQICNCHFYCNRLNGGNVKMKAAYINLINNYYDGSGIYSTNPAYLTISDSIFAVSLNTNHILKFDTDLTGYTTMNSVYITNTLVEDLRGGTTSIDFITSSFNPTEDINCYIDKINNPTYVNINNPYNVFSFKNSNLPMVVPDSYFRATNSNHIIGTHQTLTDWYEVTANGNIILTNYTGSTSAYPWVFAKIFVPEKMRIKRNVIGTSNSNIEFFDSNETYLGVNKITLEKGYYYVGIYRTLDLNLST